jgi:hypothetical protein
MKARMETYTSHQFDLLGNSVRIRINSNHEQVWKDYFTQLFTAAGLTSGPDYSVTDPGDWHSSSQFLDIELKGMKFISEKMGIMEVTI